MLVEKGPQNKRTFEDTKRAYRKAYEQVVGDRLREMGLSWEADLSIVGIDGELSVRAGKNSKNEILIFSPVKGRPLRKRDSSNKHSITQIYLFDPDKSLEEIGSHYKITRERVRQQVKKGVLGILAEAKIPIEPNELSFRKPLKPLSDAVKDRLSSFHGGVMLRIKEAVGSGVSLPDLRKMGFNENQINDARKRLSKRENPICVPRTTKDWREIRRILQNTSTPRVVLCERIKQIDKTPYNNRKPNNIFESISGLARKSGLYPRDSKGDIKFIAEHLASQNFPVGVSTRELKSGKHKGKVQTDRFGLKRLEEEGIILLRSAKGERFEKMRKPPIVVVGPVPDKMPTTMDLQKKNNHSSIFPLLKTYNINSTNTLRGLGISLSELITNNPPVAVFKMSKDLSVANSDRDRLQEFLGRRLQEINTPEKM